MRCRSSRAETRDLALAPILMSLAMLPLTSGCPQPISVDQSDRLPDAAAAPYIQRPACRYEPREVAKLKHVEGDLLARLVRSEDGLTLVRHEKAEGKAATSLIFERVEGSGELTKAGSTSETGQPGDVLALDAVAGGGNLLISLTRPGGRVDIISAGPDGRTKAPPQTFTTESEGPARLVWYSGAPLVIIGGALVGTDGAKAQLFEASASGEDAGDGGPVGDDSADAGAVAQPVDVPPGILALVAAGDTVGWLRSDADGLWLEHAVRDRGSIIRKFVAPASHDDVRLLWAGDRYIVGDSAGADIARFVVARPRARSKRHLLFLDLGGRMHLPRPPTGITWTAWDNAGARHLGLAQLLGPRHLRFVNVALGGTALDSAIHIRRERDIVAADVAWDGHGYVLIWAERVDRLTDQLMVARFSCPDDG